MAVPPASYISTFSGIGALDLAVERVFPSARPLVYVENDAANALRLAARMEEGALAAAPVWSDIRTLPVALFRGRADLVIGGFPCQDLSLAGKRGGINGRRSGLFFALIRAVRDLQPRYLFLENVSAITVGRDLDAVAGALADIGFDALWGCLRASDVGAPHGRRRWWCLAWDRQQLADAKRGRCDRRPYDAGRGSLRGIVAARAGAADHPELGDPECAGRHGVHERGETRHLASDVGVSGAGEEGGVALSYWPPGPDDHDGWADVLRDRPWLTPATVGAVRRVADGAPAGMELCVCHRSDRLRGLGNAVVPAQAEAALRLLWRDAFGAWP